MPDESKTCTRCGKEKPLAEFCNSKTYADGKYPHCQICTYMLPDEVDRDEFIKATYALSNQKLAEHYGLSQSAIERWKTGLRKQGFKLGTVRTYQGYTRRPVVNEVEPEEWPEVEPAGFPESITEDYTDYEVLDRDRSVILGDAHIPDHDHRVLDMVYRLAERFNIKTLILNGDFVKVDSFSKWKRTHPSRHEFVKDELLPATEILKLFMRQFNETFWHRGNHEDWLIKAVDGHFDISFFFQNLLGVNYSAYPFTVQLTGGEEVLICHPKNHRVNPLSLPLKYCGQYLKHVICGHLHRMAFGWHESGRFWGAEGGHALDVKKTHYKAASIDTFPAWNPGFILLMDAWPHMIEPRNYDFYMKPYADIDRPRREGPTEEELAEMERHKQALMEFEAKHGTHR